MFCAILACSKKLRKALLVLSFYEKLETGIFSSDTFLPLKINLHFKPLMSALLVFWKADKISSTFTL